MPDSFLGLLAIVVSTVVIYELLRWAVVRRIKGRLKAGAVRFVREHRVRLESARFIDRVWLREALLQDPAIDRAVMQAAQDDDEPVMSVRARVEAYVDEIAPTFSITAYYRLGGLLAKLAVDFCYELVFDQNSYQQAIARVPKGAITVFVINHRSNADYVVLSYGLLRHMALSYAVGEWARVWPVDVLFRAFGSYFVRRGEKDPLYHSVLERYVQLLVGNGGVTGFFIEGGLSRDGFLRKPKTGLLDYIVGLRREKPDAEIWFVPVGVNFDRVLEDRNLVAERGASDPPTALDKLKSLVRLVGWVPLLIGANLVRVASRSHRKFGYAAVTVGEPVRWTELQGDTEIAALARPERRQRLDGVAATLVDHIAHVIPATPVPVFCRALLESDDLGERAVIGRVQNVLVSLRSAGAPLALGEAFSDAHQAAGSAMASLDREITELAEAEMVVTLAGHALVRRKLVQHEGGRFFVLLGSETLLRYYAASIAHHLPRGE